ncbi:MAG: cobyrinate a,c-diamide synthase, partial [Gammaproteobacteria bacterium]
MSRLYISAARKSSGKTTVALGLCAALRKRGLRVRAFKKGPDYIDPMWLARAAGGDCINLDFHTMRAPEIRAAYARHACGGGLAIIEGNKGLHDGLDAAGRDSNAALAKLLRAPVLLVLDASGMTRGIAPAALGQQAFDRGVHIAGVILNRVGGDRHEAKLRAALERHTDIAVLGALRRDCALEITERHLGLVTAAETAANRIIDNIAAAITEQVDLDALQSIAEAAPAAPSPPPPPQSSPPRADITIGIARDAAFGFYYADDLQAFASLGARLVPFDALRDAAPPEADGLYIGGGFPETHAAALAGNRAMRGAVKRFVDLGGPVYAECGGLMYLAQGITWGGR